MRSALDAYGKENNKPMYLTAAVGAGIGCVKDMECDKIGQILDWINLMTYDMRAGDYAPAGHHTNLFAQTGNEDGQSGDLTVKQYAEAGIPVEKMVLGCAFYGRVWKKTAGLNQPCESAATMPYTDLYWKCLHREQGDDGTGTHPSGYVRYWDELAHAPYLYDGENHISYDDEESLKHKCKYVLDNNMTGIMYWEYGNDKTHRLLDTLTDPENWKREG
jgi:chitinase